MRGNLEFQGLTGNKIEFNGGTLVFDGARTIDVGTGSVTIAGGTALGRSSSSGILEILAGSISGPTSGLVRLNIVDSGAFLTANVEAANFSPETFDISSYREGTRVYEDGGIFYLEIGSGALPLEWVGSGNWRIGTGYGGGNWHDGTTSVDVDFMTGDIAYFKGQGSPTVNLVGSVSPKEVNVTAGSYRFEGSGYLSAGNVNVSSGASLTLANTSANTYANTNISSGGTVVATRVDSLGLGTVNNAGTLNLQIAEHGELSNVLTGAGAINKTGAGNIILTGNSTATGTLTVTDGSIQIGDGGTSGNYAGNIVSNANVIFNRSDAWTYVGDMSGAGSLVKLGIGALTLTGTTSSRVEINAGSVIVGNTGTLQGGANVNTGGTLYVTATQNYEDAPLQGGTLTVNTGGTLLTTFDNNYHIPVGTQIPVYIGNEMGGFLSDGEIKTVPNFRYKIVENRWWYANDRLYYLLERGFSSEMFPNISPQIGPVIDAYEGGNDFIEHLLANIDDIDAMEISLQSGFDLVNLAAPMSALYNIRTAVGNAIYRRSLQMTDGVQPFFRGQICGRRQPLDLWVSPIYGNSRGFGLMSGNFRHGFVNDQYAIGVGVDTSQGTTRYGVMGLGGWGRVHSNGDLAKTWNDTGFGGAYAYMNTRRGDFDFLLSAGWLGMDNGIRQRTIDGDLTGKMTSGLASLSATLTRVIGLGELCVWPSFGIEYGYYYQGGLSADWNGQTVFRNEKSSANMVVLPMGARFTRNMPMGGSMLMPEQRARYIANVGDVSSKYDVWLTGSPTSALMATRMADRHSCDFGVGLGWSCRCGCTMLRGDYGYMFGQNYRDQYISVMGIWKF